MNIIPIIPISQVGIWFEFLIFLEISYDCFNLHTLNKVGGETIELQDVLRVAGVGLVIALLHLFFEQTGKKEFSFFLFFIAYMYMTVELVRFLRLFFQELLLFFEWLTSSGLS